MAEKQILGFEPAVDRCNRELLMLGFAVAQSTVSK
jgi:hypothetical protein